jgi:nitroreductase
VKEIFERISIRKYENRPVEEEKIRQVLKAAMAAPSAGNQQPWEFYVVRDPEMIRKLADTTPYSKSAAGAPVVIVPCYRTNGLWAPMYDTIDLSIATENMLLEITSLGLGAVWMGIAPIEDRILAVDRILGLGEDLHSFALVPVGYPAESRPQQDRFQEERIHWIG